MKRTTIARIERSWILVGLCGALLVVVSGFLLRAGVRRAEGPPTASLVERCISEEPDPVVRHTCMEAGAAIDLGRMLPALVRVYFEEPDQQPAIVAVLRRHLDDPQVERVLGGGQPWGRIRALLRWLADHPVPLAVAWVGLTVLLVRLKQRWSGPGAASAGGITMGPLLLAGLLAACVAWVVGRWLLPPSPEGAVDATALRQVALDAAAGGASPALIARLTEMLSEGGLPERTQSGLIMAIGEAGPQLNGLRAAPVLRTLAVEGTAPVRAAAFEALGRLFGAGNGSAGLGERAQLEGQLAAIDEFLAYRSHSRGLRLVRAEVLADLGRYEEGRYAEALRELDRYLVEGADSPHAWVVRAGVHLALGAHEAAHRDATAALDTPEGVDALAAVDRVDAIETRFRAHLAGGAPDASDLAVADLERLDAAGRCEGRADLLFLASLLHQRRGERGPAAERLEAYLQADPFLPATERRRIELRLAELREADDGGAVEPRGEVLEQGEHRGAEHERDDHAAGLDR